LANVAVSLQDSSRLPSGETSGAIASSAQPKNKKSKTAGPF
jgi:hypothetical protein